MAMLYFGWRAVERPRFVHLGATGILGALACLTRPEGAVFFGVFLLYFLADQSLRRPIADMRSRLAGGAFAVLAFLTLVLPYIAFLHTHTGKWQLSGKTDRMLQYLSETAQSRDPLLGEKIVFHLSPDKTRVTMADELAVHRRFLIRRYVVNLQEQEALLLSMLGLPGTLLAALGFLGGWTDTEQRRKTLYLLVMLAPMLVFPLFFVEARFLIPFVPVLLIWVARGLIALADWFRATFVEKASLSTVRSGLFSARDVAFPSTGVFAVIVVVLLLLYFSTPLVKWAMAGPPDETEKHFGLALRRELGELSGEFLMSRDPIVAFYAGAKHFPLPYVEGYDDLLACLRVNRIRYLLVDERVIPALRPALASLLDPTQDHQGLTPRCTFHISRKLIVYESQLR